MCSAVWCGAPEGARGTTPEPMRGKVDEGAASPSKRRSHIKTKTVNLRVYDDSKGDTKKGGSNLTAANVTHMIDALIWIEVIRLFYQKHPGTSIPLYMNHDGFYTTLDYLN